jgi:hypothetical protein
MPSASGDYMVTATWTGDDVYSGVSRTVNFAVSPFGNQNQNVFSVASNSTLSSLAFDSTNNDLSFTVSGPPGTTGYVQVCIPQSLIPDISNLKVTLDNTAVGYNSLSKGDVWLITFMYHHSTHNVVMALSSEASNSGQGSLGNLLGNQLVLVAIIAVLVAVIAVLVILNRRKTKLAKNN